LRYRSVFSKWEPRHSPVVVEDMSTPTADISKLNVRPLDLTKMAASIASTYRDKGAIVITSGDDGIRIGVHGLDLREAEDALCTAIYHVVSKALD
jgi:hypothetical protein